jgi:hypothetical protein
MRPGRPVASDAFGLRRHWLDSNQLRLRWCERDATIWNKLCAGTLLYRPDKSFRQGAEASGKVSKMELAISPGGGNHIDKQGAYMH